MSTHMITYILDSNKNKNKSKTKNRRKQALKQITISNTTSPKEKKS